RDYSYLSTLLCKVCFTVACVGTGFVNMSTFLKIAYIRITRSQNKEYKRDVRLFFLGVVQDILMTIVLLSIILCNNQQDLGMFSIVLSYDGLILIYCFNTASMLFCNPECRRFLFSRKKAAVTSSFNTATGHQSATATSKQQLSVAE
uniref:7TM_GPCR_Srx domain-containing protein n=1 Tax=Steinernema glaseri TaxID=37863 RepID=A0A1I7XY95_9BILA